MKVWLILPRRDYSSSGIVVDIFRGSEYSVLKTIGEYCDFMENSYLHMGSVGPVIYLHGCKEFVDAVFVLCRHAPGV